MNSCFCFGGSGYGYLLVEGLGLDGGSEIGSIIGSSDGICDGYLEGFPM